MGSVINIFKCSIWPIQDDYIAEALNIDSKDKPEKFWSYIKANMKRQDQTGIPPLKSDAGHKVDSLGKAETLDTQFQKVFTQEDVSSIHNKCLPSTTSIEQIVRNLGSYDGNYNENVTLK